MTEEDKKILLERLNTIETELELLRLQISKKNHNVFSFFGIAVSATGLMWLLGFSFEAQIGRSTLRYNSSAATQLLLGVPSIGAAAVAWYNQQKAKADKKEEELLLWQRIEQG